MKMGTSTEEQMNNELINDQSDKKPDDQQLLDKADKLDEKTDDDKIKETEQDNQSSEEVRRFFLF